MTAQLRDQPGMDLPIAVSSLSATELSRLGIESLEEYGRLTPGFDVQYQSPNNPGFVVRGITQDSGAAFDEPRVAVFQDGVSIARSRGSYVELFDVERVDVAKGPQATLYGRGALIGAVNIVQRKADPSAIGAFGRVDAGNRGFRIVEAMANLPVGAGAAVRIAGRSRTRDGYIKDLLGGPAFNSDDTQAVRGSVHVDRAGLTVDVIGNYQKDQPTGTSFASRSYRPVDPRTGAALGGGLYDSAALAPGAGFEGGRPLGLDRDVWGVTGLVSYRLDERLGLRAITAYRAFDALEIFDADGIALPLLTAGEGARGKQFSQEVRLTYQSGAISAFAGGTYFWEDGFQRTPAQFDERALLARLTGALGQGAVIPGASLADPLPQGLLGNTALTGALLQGAAAASGVLLPLAQATAIAANLRPDLQETSTNFSRTRAIDLFGDVSLALGDRLRIGAGLRYSQDRKRTDYVASIVNGRSVLGGVLGALAAPAEARVALLQALAVPGAGTIPLSAAFPVPPFGLGMQPTAGNGGRDRATLKDDGFSWSLTGRYQLAPQTNLYANYARGRRPQVLSTAGPALPLGPTMFETLPNERVDSFEAGIKTALLGRTLFLDGALFRYDYANFQTIEQQGTALVTTNAGRASIHGFEGQARWSPSSAVSLLASYAYLHSRFRSGSRKGNRFRLSPDHSGAISLLLSRPAGRGRLLFSTSLVAQSRIYFDDDNDLPALQQPPRALVADAAQDETQGAYLLAHARLGYEGANRAWRVEGFVENLFDRRYLRDAGNTGDDLGMPTFVAADPRYYGLSLSVRFGSARRP